MRDTSKYENVFLFMCTVCRHIIPFQLVQWTAIAKLDLIKHFIGSLIYEVI
jgi:hypothetical protein